MFLEVYNGAPSPETSKPLGSDRKINEGQQAGNETVDYVLTETLAEPSHLTFAECISLKGLPASTYQALIEAKDMITRKLVKQEASFVITR
jgi:hypothetical protein